MEILRYKPRGYSLLSNASGDSPDLSGYTVTHVDSTGRGVALTSNCTMSMYGKRPADGNAGYFLYVNTILRGREKYSFSLAATIYPVLDPAAPESRVSILSLPSQDGLWIKGTTVYFGTKYLNTGMASCSYDIEYARVVSLLGVHTPNKNSLYVNGELVAEVDITPEQQQDVYQNTDAGQIYGGDSNSNATIYVNEIAFFESALGPRAAKAIYLEQSTGGSSRVPPMFGGQLINLDESFRVPTLAWEWKNDSDWDKALQINCVTDEDQLVPEFKNGLSTDAQWLTSTVMYNAAENLTVSELDVTYVGKNASVSISFDGLNWTEVNGTAGYNFNPYRKDLYVKVDFEEGHDEAYLDNLRITAYTNNVVAAGDKTVTYNFPTATLRPHEPAELHEDWGVQVKPGGNVAVSNPSQTLGTFEVWFKPSSETINWNAFNFGNATHYIDGERVGQTTLHANVWHLLHVVPSSNYTGTPIGLNASGIYGSIALYSSALSEEQIRSIYQTYVGAPTSRTEDSTNFTITENATPVSIYVNDYTVLGS